MTQKNIKNTRHISWVFMCVFSLIASYFSLVPTHAADYKYTVERLKESGSAITYEVLHSTNDFNEAISKMNEAASNQPNVVVKSVDSKSPLKIVAADRAYLQSYPYRTGTQGTTLAKVTLDIYKNKELTTTATYIPAHYKMTYYGTEITNSGNLVAKINIQGGEGYVDIVKTDFIPLLYVEKGISITLGGNENYYTSPESSNSLVVLPDTYEVRSNTAYNVNEISVNYYRTYSTISGRVTLTYAVAPSWLPVGTYYSTDGIHFYSDIDLKNPIRDGNDVGAFYAYYQWLPVRSQSTYTGDDLHSALSSISNSTSSVIYNNEQAFIESGNKYGMNPLLIYAQAALESDYGKSGYAVSRYNLFGWAAYDSDPDQASTYSGVEVAISDHMARQLSSYFDLGDWRNAGLSFGNKGSGVSVRYASDPFYGIKIASIAYQTDRALGYKDHNMYDLAKIRDNTGLNVRKEATTNSGIWYTTPSNLTNQIITNLGITNGFAKTNLTMVIMNNAVTTQVGPVDLTQEFGYMATEYLTLITNYGPKNSTIPTERVIVAAETHQYVITVDLNLRSGWSTSSRVFSVIPKGTTLSGQLTTNGWVKVAYGGRIGYISADFTDEVVPGGTTGTIGDVNGDGRVTLLDMAMVRSHLLGINILSGDAFSGGDVNNDGQITLLDMAMIRSDLLGINPLN